MELTDKSSKQTAINCAEHHSENTAVLENRLGHLPEASCLEAVTFNRTGKRKGLVKGGKGLKKNVPDSRHCVCKGPELGDKLAEFQGTERRPGWPKQNKWPTVPGVTPEGHLAPSRPR